jgi:acetamidase/formamidase
MLGSLARMLRFVPEHAYMLTCICADLRVSSTIDQPNWVVSFMFPRIVPE